MLEFLMLRIAPEGDDPEIWKMDYFLRSRAWVLKDRNWIYLEGEDDAFNWPEDVKTKQDRLSDVA